MKFPVKQLNNLFSRCHHEGLERIQWITQTDCIIFMYQNRYYKWNYLFTGDGRPDPNEASECKEVSPITKTIVIYE